jgi:hypothetical protein
VSPDPSHLKDSIETRWSFKEPFVETELDLMAGVPPPAVSDREHAGGSAATAVSSSTLVGHRTQEQAAFFAAAKLVTGAGAGTLPQSDVSQACWAHLKELVASQRRTLQVNSRTHGPQKLTGLNFSIYQSILCVPIQTVH